MTQTSSQVSGMGKPTREHGREGSGHDCGVSAKLPHVYSAYILRYLALASVCASAATFAPINRKKYAPIYTYCAENYFGYNCKGKCNCGDKRLFECDDGPYGNGRCFCVSGKESLCEKVNNVNYEKYTFGASEYNKTSLSSLKFNNQLPNYVQVDKVSFRRSRQVGASITYIYPLPFLNPSQFRILAVDDYVAVGLLGLKGIRYQAESDVLKNEIIGNIVLDQSMTRPFAHNYGGHQFGNWAGQLGDGRALSLGEVVTNMDSNTYEIALKGAGRTPFSRSGDGRAVFHSVAREFLGGVALRALRIPTVHALAVAGTINKNTEDGIFRDEFYNGKYEQVPPGVLVRVAPSFLRLGSVQIARENIGYAGVFGVVEYALKIRELEKTNQVNFSQVNSLNLLQNVSFEERSKCFFQKTNSTVHEAHCDFSPSTERVGNIEKHKVLRCFLHKFSTRLAALIASWNAYGFVHGVMNTDNISLLGQTIDLNVFGFLGKYDLQWTSNHIDEENRYRFGNQKQIGKWNLRRLIGALVQNDHRISKHEDDLWLNNEELEKDTLKRYDDTYTSCFQWQMSLRLGLQQSNARMVKYWKRWLRRSKADYFRASRLLGEVNIKQFRAYELEKNKTGVDKVLHDFAFVTGALASANHDLRIFLNALSKHFSHKIGDKTVEEGILDWRKRIRSLNPKYILRTAPVRRIIAQTIARDLTDTSKYLELLELLKNPYDINEWRIEEEVAKMKASVSRGGQLHTNQKQESDVKRELAALQSEPDNYMKTSCGGQ